MPSHYLKKCCLILGGVLWHSPEGNFTGSIFKISILGMSLNFFLLDTRGQRFEMLEQWVSVDTIQVIVIYRLWCQSIIANDRETLPLVGSKASYQLGWKTTNYLDSNGLVFIAIMIMEVVVRSLNSKFLSMGLCQKCHYHDVTWTLWHLKSPAVCSTCYSE